MEGKKEPEPLIPPEILAKMSPEGREIVKNLKKYVPVAHTFTQYKQVVPSPKKQK